MSEEKKIKEFYKRLETQLDKDTEWPSIYLFKFIVPAEEKATEKIEEIFKEMNAQISTRNSSKGTYTSISIKVKMNSPEHVVEKYLEVSKIEGVISL
ncbi:MAG: DUF493 family protein [Flavobacteriales bacterium]